MDITNPIYNDPDAARAHLESIRWADGRFCPHCEAYEGTVEVKGKKKSHRDGLYYCNNCKKQFTVTVGTIFERSKVGLHKWVLAYQLMAASKKGMSAHQLHRMLGVTYKTAWFMAHRIRETMRDDVLPPMGGPGGAVQADETYFGTKDAYRGKPWKEKKGHSKKMSVVSLVHDGKSRTFHVARADVPTIRDILVTNIRRESELHTDESRLYVKPGAEFKVHRSINHSAGEYVRRDGVTTNNVENYFSIFKRGMRGVYQHCKEKHLQRYIDEFDFRYSNRELTDAERANLALRQAEGRRLTYLQPTR